MKEEILEKQYFWEVEAVTDTNQVLFKKIFLDFSEACDKFLSFKKEAKKGRVSLQRKYKIVKVV